MKRPATLLIMFIVIFAVFGGIKYYNTSRSNDVISQTELPDPATVIVAKIGSVNISKGMLSYAALPYTEAASLTELMTMLDTVDHQSVAKLQTTLNTLIEKAALIELAQQQNPDLFLGDKSELTRMLKAGLFPLLPTSEDDLEEFSQLWEQLDQSESYQQYVSFMTDFSVAAQSISYNEFPPLEPTTVTEEEVQALYAKMKTEEPFLPPLEEVRDMIENEVLVYKGFGQTEGRLKQAVDLVTVQIFEENI